MPTAKKAVKSVDEVNTLDVGADTKRESGIIVRDINIIRPKVLPLIVEFPEGYEPSLAQVERAKVLNGFAYQFPDQWEKKKAVLLAELEALKDAPDPVVDENSRLEIINRNAPKNVI